MAARSPLGSGPELIVANHLTYFDVLAFGSAFPCVFVAKREVRSWPLFGLLASLGGTLFIERGNRASTLLVAMQVKQLLSQGVSVMLFPEGTSSDGSTVMRFHPSLFEPAIACQAPVTAAAIRYACADLPGGEAVPEKDLCYYGDDVFLPHLMKALARRGLRAGIRFGENAAPYSDRRTAATASWREVMRLRQCQLQSREPQPCELRPEDAVANP